MKGSFLLYGLVVLLLGRRRRFVKGFLENMDLKEYVDEILRSNLTLQNQKLSGLYTEEKNFVKSTILANRVLKLIHKGFLQNQSSL